MEISSVTTGVDGNVVVGLLDFEIDIDFLQFVIVSNFIKFHDIYALTLSFASSWEGVQQNLSLIRRESYSKILEEQDKCIKKD